MKPRLQATLGQHLVMTPQLQQAIRLLQLSAAELDAELTTAVEQANTAKFMIKDFWAYFKFRLAEYRVDFKPSEDLWQRYYLPPK